jgi:type IX secretion system PorP/SprF family membrane protein
MKKISIIFLFIVVFLKAWSQDLNISQYLFYRDGVNPGSFLQDNDINVFLLYNKGLLEFEKQPTTELIDVNLNLGGKKVGISFYNDVIGFDKSQNFRLRYAQQFKLTDKSFLSFGLGAGVQHNYLDVGQMTFEFDNDPLILLDYNYTRVDFDFGTEFQINKLTIGFSALHLGKQIKNEYNDSPAPHYYLYSEYAIKVGNTFVLFPNLLFRQWKNTFWGEAGLVAFYKKMVWLGATYTRHHDFTANTGFKISKNIMFGYAYKVNLDPQILKPGSNESHEIFLNFTMKKRESMQKTPRFID